jgi:hypothetical protein
VIPLNSLDTEKGAPLAYKEVTLSLRPDGYQSVRFSIKEAKSLWLKIGDQLIAPDIVGVEAGSVAYRIPITSEIDALFDDTRYMALGFQLVDVIRIQGKDQLKFRDGGFMRLTPRFPLRYQFKVFPPGGKVEGESREISQGPAILNLVQSVPNKDVLVTARRHGDLYRAAKSRLAVGTSYVSVPQGSHWELTVTFPDGKGEVLAPEKQRGVNDFGTVTVRPYRNGDLWSLMIDVELKR